MFQPAPADGLLENIWSAELLTRAHEPILLVA
jgi:hypothetical protein